MIALEKSSKRDAMPISFNKLYSEHYSVSSLCTWAIECQE